VALAPGADNFITDSLQRHLLPVPAGADPEMQFLHAHDLATAVEGVLLRGRGGPYNLAGGGTVRWREVIRLTGGRPLPVPARLLSGLMGLTWRARIQSRSTSAGLALIRYPWLADTTRAETELDWKPQWSSRQAVEAWGASRPVGVT
jgi:UDP-glucose 4-epimerase